MMRTKPLLYATVCFKNNRDIWALLNYLAELFLYLNG